MGFDFEKMVCAFEAVSFGDPLPPAERPPPPPRLPLARPFLAAMSEVALLFDHLGTGFSFVRRDISAKVAVMHAHTPAADDLSDMILAEHPADGSAGVVPAGAPPATRTLLRLMWATRFLDVLMHELAASFAADSASESGVSESDDGRGAAAARTRTLRDAVSRAYDVALAKHHSWGVRRTVAAAVYLLPSKEAFVEKLGVDLSRRDEYLARINVSLSPLVGRMYAFYDLHNLHET
jgi:hypothetical protein